VSGKRMAKRCDRGLRVSWEKTGWGISFPTARTKP